MSYAPEIITGDAVPLELRLAKLPSRALAITIDFAIEGLALIALSFLFGALAPNIDPAAGAALFILVLVLVFIGYPTALETLTRGRSVGKFALGLRVVRDDGGPAGFRQAFLRALAGIFVDFWFTSGAGAIISSLASTKGKRVGDFLAGTVVVRERVPGVVAAPPAQMPPWLADWAANADLARVPDDLALQARQFLARVEHLDPATRQTLAVRLATEIGAFVAPPSPPGTAAEYYLAAVLAERRRRDLWRNASHRPLVQAPVATSSPGQPPVPSPPAVPSSPAVPGPPDASAFTPPS